MSNSTYNADTNFQKLPVELTTVMRIVFLLIVFLNTTVILCLTLFKHKIQRNYTVQILCLCVCDIISGIGILLFSTRDYKWIRQGVIRCSVVTCFFLSSQSNTVYNVMAISINRFIMLKRIHRTGYPLTIKRVVILYVTGILASFGLCSLPFFSIGWTQNQMNYNGGECSLKTLFQDNRQAAIILFFVAIFVPLVTTNILYVSLMVILNRAQGRVSPNFTRNDKACHAPNTTAPKTDNIELSHMELRDQPQAGTSSEIPELIEIRTSERTIAGADEDQECLNRKYAYQKKALSLIGLVLLFLNICTWPAVIQLMAEMNNETWYVDTGRKIPVFSIICVNSVINPILYTIRIPEFRRVLLNALFPCAKFK